MVTINDDECMANFRFSPTVELPIALRPTAPRRATVQERTQLINTPSRDKNGCERAAVALFIFLLALGVFFVLGTFFIIEEKEAAIVSDLRATTSTSTSCSARPTTARAATSGAPPPPHRRSTRLIPAAHPAGTRGATARAPRLVTL